MVTFAVTVLNAQVRKKSFSWRKYFLHFDCFWLVLYLQSFYREYLVGLRIRTGLISAIYRKSLRLSNTARKEMTGMETNTTLIALASLSPNQSLPWSRVDSFLTKLQWNHAKMCQPKLFSYPISWSLTIFLYLARGVERPRLTVTVSLHFFIFFALSFCSWRDD